MPMTFRLLVALSATMACPYAALAQTSQPAQQQASPSADNRAPTIRFIPEQKIGQWRASKFVGLTVLGADGQSIGEVEDILANPDGRITTVVLGTGGFMGYAEKRIAVPFEALEWSSRSIGSTRHAATTPDQATTGSVVQNGSTATRSAFVSRGGEPDHGILRLTEAQIEQAPAFHYAGRSYYPLDDTHRARPSGDTANPGADDPPPATPARKP